MSATKSQIYSQMHHLATQALMQLTVTTPLLRSEISDLHSTSLLIHLCDSTISSWKIIPVDLSDNINSCFQDQALQHQINIELNQLGTAVNGIIQLMCNIKPDDENDDNISYLYLHGFVSTEKAAAVISFRVSLTENSELQTNRLEDDERLLTAASDPFNGFWEHQRSNRYFISKVKTQYQITQRALTSRSPVIKPFIGLED